MRKDGSLEQWKELYELGAELKGLEPWKYFWDTDLLAICPEGRTEPFFSSVMGRGGSCCAISVYKGMEGLRDFDMLASAELMRMPVEYAIFEQNNLTCYWGDREEVPSEQKKIIKELGLRFRGRGQWLYFLSFKKRYSPFTPEADEVEDLIKVYHGLILAVKAYKEGQIPVDYEKGEILWYLHKKKGNLWSAEIHGLPEKRHREYTVVELEDETLKKRLQKRPRVDGEIQLDFVYLNESIREKEYDRPLNPLLFMAVDGDSGMVIMMSILKPKDEEIDIALSFLVQFIEQHGRIRTVKARNPWIFAALEDLCEYCGIELLNDNMQELEETIESLQEHLG